MFQGCHPATACSCMCSERRDPYSVKQRLNLPHCRPGAACKSDCAVRWRAISLQPAKTVAIVLLSGFDARHTRSTDNNPFREYLRDMMLMLRLVLSLRRVGTTLPALHEVRVNLSGAGRAGVGRTVHRTPTLGPPMARWLFCQAFCIGSCQLQQGSCARLGLRRASKYRPHGCVSRAFVQVPNCAGWE